MSEGVKEKAEAKAKGKGRAKKAVAVVAIVLVALLALSAFSDAIDDACAKAGSSGVLGVLRVLAGKLKDFGGKVREGLKTAGEKVKSAFERMVGWLSSKFKASAPSTSTTTSTSTSTATSTTPSTPSTPTQPVEVKEPVVLSVKTVPVKVSPKLFSDEVSSMEDPKAIVISKEFNNWVWTDECAHSGKHSIRGRAGFWLKLPTNRSDFNLYDRLVMYVKAVGPSEVMERFTGVIMGFDVPGWGPLISLPLKEGDYSWPKWDICKVRVSRESEWWRLEVYEIKWGGLDVWDRVGFTIVPDDPKLYDYVTFYVDDVQLYSSRSDACLLLVEVRIPYNLIHDNKTYCYFKERTEAKNLRISEIGVSYKAIYDRELLRSLGRPTVNEVYVPISVQRGDVLEVTFTFTYYYNDGKYLHEDDALVFNRIVTVTVE